MSIKAGLNRKIGILIGCIILGLGLGIFLSSCDTGGALSGGDSTEFGAAKERLLDISSSYNGEDEALELDLYSDLDYAFSLLLEGKVSEKNFLSLLERLNENEAIIPVTENYEKAAQNHESLAAAYEKAAGSNEPLEIISLLEPVRALSYAGFPDGEILERNAYFKLYKTAVPEIKAHIKAAEFDLAQEKLAPMLSVFPDDTVLQNLDFSSKNMVLYDGVVQHYFYHPLIAYPERAFDGDLGAAGQDNYMTTVPEFVEVTRQLYEKGYILVDLSDLYDTTFDENGGVIAVTPKTLYLPEGKKPYILSIDDINYYEYMRKDGQVFKLVLNDEGRVVTYSVDLGGNDVYSTDNEIVPILDDFVDAHPDSTLNGAKGCLAVTGYYGILGYRTDEPTWEGYETEKENALAVVARLKETGWTFASHSQGHRHTAKISYELLANDTDRWAREVLPLIGPTSVYIYPFGEAVPPSDDKFKYLQKNGFGFFCTVGSNSRLDIGHDYIIQARRNIDGIALRDKRLYDVLDVPKIIDPVRPSYEAWATWARAQGII